MDSKTMKFPPSIKVAAVLIDGFFNISSKGVTGQDGKLLTYLSEMFHFQYRVLTPTDGAWGSLSSSGHWTGMVGMLTRDEADLALTYMAVTEERNKVVDFSTPYAVLDRTFASNVPGFVDRFGAFTYPFSTGVWLACMGTIAAGAFLFQKIVFRKRSWLGMFLVMLGSLLGQPLKRCGDSIRQKMVYASWVVFATIIPFVYSALLLSFLTMPTRQRGVQTFRELSEAVLQGQMRCLVPSATVDLELMLGSNMNYMTSLGRKIQKMGWRYDHTNKFEHLVGEDTAIVCSRQVLKLNLGVGSSLSKFVSRDSFGAWNVAIAVRKGFCCKELLDEAVLRVQGSGLFLKWREDEQFRINLGKSKSSGEKVEKIVPLALEDLKGIIVVVILGYVGGFLVLMFEVYLNGIVLKRHPKSKVALWAESILISNRSKKII